MSPKWAPGATNKLRPAVVRAIFGTVASTVATIKTGILSSQVSLIQANKPSENGVSTATSAVAATCLMGVKLDKILS